MHRRKKIFPALLILLILVELYFLLDSSLPLDPYFPSGGITTAEPYCYMRPRPNTENTPIWALERDIPIKVLSRVRGQDIDGNASWYQVRYGQLVGYISAEFVRLTYPYRIEEMDRAERLFSDADPAFRASLQAVGFPDDYIEPLLKLHKDYPQWIFTPLHVNRRFNNAVQAESRPGVSMVGTQAPYFYKSLDPSIYRAETASWLEYEPGWTAASSALLAFQMDPRNFLNEPEIFQFENQSYNPKIAYQGGLEALTAGTFMAGKTIHYRDRYGQEQTLDMSYPELLEEAGRLSGVSPYHLLARILQEVSPAGSDSVSGNHRDVQGFYNFFNIGAYGGDDPIYLGLLTARDGFAGFSQAENAKYHFPWDNPASAILGGAIFIGEDYINMGQASLYLQKFNLVSPYTNPYDHQYMTNVQAPQREAINVYKAYQEMGTLDQAKDFLIPVFLDMPLINPPPSSGGPR